MIIDIDSLGILEDSDKPFVVCFTNPVSCAPCRAFEPHYKAASKHFVGIPFYEVNVLGHMDIAEAYGVTSTPTVKFVGDERPEDILARTTLTLIKELNAFLGI